MKLGVRKREILDLFSIMAYWNFAIQATEEEEEPLISSFSILCPVALHQRRHVPPDC